MEPPQVHVDVATVKLKWKVCVPIVLCCLHNTPLAVILFTLLYTLVQ